MPAVRAGVAGDPGGTKGVLLALWQFFSDRPVDFDLGFYLFGGVRQASLSPELDDTLNQHLDALFVHIGDCLITEGLAPPTEAHRVAVLHGTWIFGLLLMAQTGRLKSLGESARPLLDLYLTNSLSNYGGMA